MDKQQKTKFWILMTLFVMFSLIIPITYLSIRFSLFSVVEFKAIRVSFWAIFLVLLILIILIVMIKYYLSGLKTKYSFFKKLLTGLVKFIIPLVMIILCVFLLKGKMLEIANATSEMVEPIRIGFNRVLEALSIITISELVAICVNPLPKWAFDNNVDGLGQIADKVFKKGGE